MEAKLLISLIEFLISFKSRFNACAFISDEDVVVDCDCCDDVELLEVDCEIWCSRDCDEDCCDLEIWRDELDDVLFNT